MTPPARPTSSALQRLQAIARALAWLAFAALAGVTLIRLGLRPVTTGGADLERFGAWFVAASLFALAYRKHLVRSLIFLLASAALLELMQTLTPDRHAHLSDAIVKLAGVLAGFAAATSLARLPRLVAALRPRDRPRQP